MPHPRTPARFRYTAAELRAAKAELSQPLTPPRPWLRNCPRLPNAARILAAKIERELLTR